MPSACEQIRQGEILTAEIRARGGKCTEIHTAYLVERGQLVASVFPYGVGWKCIAKHKDGRPWQMEATAATALDAFDEVWSGLCDAGEIVAEVYNNG
jgi:hypothetical protein